MSAYVDNRDRDDMARYLEARIEALKKENDALKLENAELKRQLIQRESATDATRRHDAHLGHVGVE